VRKRGASGGSRCILAGILVGSSRVCRWCAGAPSARPGQLYALRFFGGKITMHVQFAVLTRTHARPVALGAGRGEGVVVAGRPADDGRGRVEKGTFLFVSIRVPRDCLPRVPGYTYNIYICICICICICIRLPTDETDQLPPGSV